MRTIFVVGLLFFAGCGATRVVSKPPPWQPRPLSSPVVAVVGCQSADTLRQQLDAMLRTYRVTPMRGRFARFWRRVYGLKDSGRWLDGTRPVYAMMLSPKRFRRPLLLIVPFKSRTTLLAALPGAKPRKSGSGWRYQHLHRSIYADLLGSYLILSEAPGSFRAVEPFITARLIGWRPSRPVVANLGVTTLKRIYHHEIQFGLSYLRSGSATARRTVSMMEVLLALDAVTVTAGQRNGRLRVRATVHSQPGSPAGVYLTATRGSRFRLRQRIPARSWFTASANIPARYLESLSDVESVIALLKRHNILGSDAAMLRAAYSKLARLGLGEGHHAFHVQDRWPLALSMVYSIKDASAYQQVMFAMLAAYRRISARALDRYATHPAVGKLQKLFSSGGLRLQTGELNGIHYGRLTLDYGKLRQQFGHQRWFDLLERLLGPQLEAAMALRGQLMVTSIAPRAIAMVQSLLLQRQLPADLKSVVQQIPPNASFGMALHMRTFLDSLALIAPQEGALLSRLSARLSPGAALTLSISGADTLSVVVDLAMHDLGRVVRSRTLRRALKAIFPGPR